MWKCSQSRPGFELVDADKAYGEKAWQQLHKNAMSYTGQIQRQLSIKQQLYGHLPPIWKAIQIRGTRNAGPYWRSKNEFISNILQWTLHTDEQVLDDQNPVCPTILPIAGGRVIGFVPFPRVLVLCENANSLVQDLNSCRRVHFLRR